MHWKLPARCPYPPPLNYIKSLSPFSCTFKACLPTSSNVCFFSFLYLYRGHTFHLICIEDLSSLLFTTKVYLPYGLHKRSLFYLHQEVVLFPIYIESRSSYLRRESVSLLIYPATIDCPPSYFYKRSLYPFLFTSNAYPFLSVSMVCLTSYLHQMSVFLLMFTKGSSTFSFLSKVHLLCPLPQRR